jgi:paraquat-inducible protein B
MSRRANPTLIGGFIIGAIALAVAAALVFGSFTFFQVTRRFVVFFEGTVEGLAVGSPVLFRGVPIGQVHEITIRYNPDKNDLTIPVIVDINPGVIERWTPERAFATTKMQGLLEKGLRARLESTSFVTGQKAVQLDFFPDTPIILHQTDIRFREIPAVPSQVRELMSSAEAAAKDLPGLIKTATEAIERVQTLLSPENQQAISQMLGHTVSLTAVLGRDAEALEKTIAAADRLLGGVSDVAVNVNGVIDENRPGLRQLVRYLQSTVLDAGRLLDQAKQVVNASGVPLRHFTERSLADLAVLITDTRNAVNKMSNVLEELNRNPSRFLLGNKTDHGVQLK